MVRIRASKDPSGPGRQVEQAVRATDRRLLFFDRSEALSSPVFYFQQLDGLVPQFSPLPPERRALSRSIAGRSRIKASGFLTAVAWSLISDF
jgi:hypothetical protein